MIEKELLIKLEERVEEVNKLFPKTKITIEILINKIVGKYLEKKLRDNKKTDGSDWLIFRRENSVRMWREAKHKCFYCERPIPFHASTIDHKYPVGRGGNLLDIDNMVIACKWCNQDKDFLTDEEYFYKQLHNTAKGIKPS